jgi:dolichol-phosphate mannosyltransferase
MGMLGLYVGRIYEEVKARPVYIVRETIGFRDAPAPEPASVELQR